MHWIAGWKDGPDTLQTISVPLPGIKPQFPCHSVQNITTDLGLLGFSVVTYSTHLACTSVVSHKYAGHISGKILIH
jgi:hypothetical protein